jgi:molecular chaperone DnaK
MTDMDVSEIEEAKDRLLSDAQTLFAKAYEQPEQTRYQNDYQTGNQGGYGYTNSNPYQGGFGYSNNNPYQDDDIIDVDYREVS